MRVLAATNVHTNKEGQVKTRAVRMLMLVVVAVLLLAGCGSEKKAVREYIGATALLLDEWEDVEDRASRTSRMALSPVIGDLQDIRRRYAALDTPEPCWAMRDNLVGSMQYSIDGYLAFLADEDSSVINGKFALADQRAAWALESLELLLEEYGD
jgi:hypothetical protein